MKWPTKCRFTLKMTMGAVTVLCVFLGYVRSYYSLVVCKTIVVEDRIDLFGIGGDPLDDRRTYYRHPDYRFGGEASRVIFEPAHELDRLIRPAYWQTDWDVTF